MRRRTVLGLIAAGAAGGVAAVALRPRPGVVVQGPQPLGALVWHEPSYWFGGLSAVHLAADGMQLTVLSDQSVLMRARVARDSGGQLAGVAVQSYHRLRDSRGRLLPEGRRDSEGLAILADGTICVAFEGRQRVRVRAYADPDAPARDLPVHDDFRRFRGNRGLEALAVDPAGRLHAIPEAARDGAFPVYRLDGEAWSVAASIPAEGPFLPVGADFGPDGRFYLLERAYRGPLGFASRLRRIDPAHWDSVRTVLEIPFGRHINLEGLSVTRDPAGRLRATTVSDNNHYRLIDIELVEYALPG